MKDKLVKNVNALKVRVQKSSAWHHGRRTLDVLKGRIKGRSFWRYSFIAVLAVAVLIAGYSGWLMFFASSSDSHEEHEESGVRTVEVTEAAQELAELKIVKSEPRLIKTTVSLNGRISPDQNHLARISARYPGVVKQVYKELGDSVKIGETLASIEANGSLSVFPVTSRIAGTIIKKEIVSGEFVSDKEVIFEVADLSEVWVNLNVTEQDFGKIKQGQPVRVRMWDHEDSIETKLTYVAPIVHADSQTMLARAVLDGTSGVWRPGSFVTADVTVGAEKSPVTVAADAIQLVDEKPVVFVKTEDEVFEVRNVTLGPRGKRFVAVADGLASGEAYVSKNSFVLKAELLKSLAGHDHGH